MEACWDKNWRRKQWIPVPLYNPDCTQEGPMELVVALGSMEHAFKVFHSPYRAETKDILLARGPAVLSRWEAMA